jgi:hypothetical protein
MQDPDVDVQGGCKFWLAAPRFFSRVEIADSTIVIVVSRTRLAIFERSNRSTYSMTPLHLRSPAPGA